MRDYYSVFEDVVKTIGIDIPHSDRVDAPSSSGFSLQIHDSRCYGCQRHGMSVMLSYRDGAPDDAHIRDFFLDTDMARFLLSKIDRNERELRTNGMTLRLGFHLDQEAPLELYLPPTQTKNFLDMVAQRRTNFNLNGPAADPDFPEMSFLGRSFKRHSADDPPPTPVDLGDYYKFDAQDIPLDGLDAGLLLAALYNNAKTGGIGSQHFKNHIMTPAEGRHILSEALRAGALPEFDYINGRSVKAWFGVDDAGQIASLHFSRFWDYNDLPVTFVVTAARSGHYGRLQGQDILDLENEARILMGKDADRLHDPQELIAAAGLRPDIGAQMDHITQQQDTPPPRRYQITIAGNGPLRGEIGEQIAPFGGPLDAQTTPTASPKLH